MSNHATLVAAARTAVFQACRVCREVQKSLERVKAITKDDKSPVTVADYASQAIVAHTLASRLGGSVRLVGEEAATVLRQDDHAAHREATLAAVRAVWPDASENAVLDAIDLGGADASDAFWTLDPVDGTKGFLRNQQYAVSLCYVENGRPTVGVLGCPNLPRPWDRSFDEPDSTGCLYIAIKGQGVTEASAADAGDQGVRVSRASYQTGAAIRMCESVESGHSNQSDSANIMGKLGPAGTPSRLDSQCKYAVVARGQADCYLRMPTKKGYIERIWDHAAGALVATECGCEVSDVAGKPLDFSCGRGLEKNRGVVCAPKGLHGRIIAAIRELGLDKPLA